MQRSWQNRKPTDLTGHYLDCLHSVWHYITHGLVCIKGGHLWRAVLYVEKIRHSALELACLRHNLEPKNSRQVQRLPEDLLAKFENGLIGSLSHEEIITL
jgi:hypothetical protein